MSKSKEDNFRANEKWWSGIWCRSCWYSSNYWPTL